MTTKQFSTQASTTEIASRVVAALLRRESEKADAAGDLHPLFTLGGNVVFSGELGNPDCLLPVIVWHAERLNRQGMNKKDALEAGYPSNSAAYLGRSVSLEGFTGALSEALLFLMESFHDIRDNSPKDKLTGESVELDHVVAQFRDAQPAPLLPTRFASI